MLAFIDGNSAEVVNGVKYYFRYLNEWLKIEAIKNKILRRVFIHKSGLGNLKFRNIL